MGADKSAENAPKLLCPSPKVWDFNEKRLHWESVVCTWSTPNDTDLQGQESVSLHLHRIDFSKPGPDWQRLRKRLSDQSYCSIYYILF